MTTISELNPYLCYFIKCTVDGLLPNSSHKPIDIIISDHIKRIPLYILSCWQHKLRFLICWSRPLVQFGNDSYRVDWYSFRKWSAEHRIPILWRKRNPSDIESWSGCWPTRRTRRRSQTRSRFWPRSGSTCWARWWRNCWSQFGAGNIESCEVIKVFEYSILTHFS